MTIIGKNLRYIRKQNKLSQTEFAQLFGLTRASVGAYEEFRAKPKDELIGRVAKFFNVEAKALEFSELNTEVAYKPTVIEPPKTEQKRPSIQVKNLFQHQIEQANEPTQHLDNQKKNHTLEKKNTPEKKVKPWPYFSQGIEEQRSADQFPFLKSCDAVFELSPFIEREKSQFQDGSVLFGYKLSQIGHYQGIFIVKENQRWFLKEGEFFLQMPSTEAWRITYILDSINSY
ncbi:MAG: helix-turn-helix domain-containing protein [Flavobacteriales bacterium]